MEQGGWGVQDLGAWVVDLVSRVCFLNLVLAGWEAPVEMRTFC